MPRRLCVTVMPAYCAPGTDSAAPAIRPLSSAGVSNDARWCRSETNWVACRYISVRESRYSSSDLGVFTVRASRSSVVGGAAQLADGRYPVTPPPAADATTHATVYTINLTIHIMKDM